MAKRIFLVLRPTAAPHLYIDNIKSLMKEDERLHPMMKNVLLMLKKTRQPFVRLATKKEILYVPEEASHWERALEPQVTPFMKVEWSEEEIKEQKDDPAKHLENISFLYDKLGYDQKADEEVTMEEVEKIKTQTKVDKQKQEEAVKKAEELQNQPKENWGTSLRKMGDGFNQAGDDIVKSLTG
jgi:hypothetical protein